MAMAMVVSCPWSSASLARQQRTCCSPSAARKFQQPGFPLRRITACDGRNHSANSQARIGGLHAVSARRDWGSASTAAQVSQGSETAEEELPVKLREIVRLFQGVGEQRARYQQLLYYGQKLTPLAKEFCTPENKVQGCVSQVWVVCKLDADDGRMYFEADSDSALTKGLAALLVEGLSGASPVEILKVSPDFIQKLGLQQSLTPSRSNGFLNMLRLMQKRTMQAYMESAGSAASSSPSAVASEETKEPDVSPAETTAKVTTTTTIVKDSIQRKLAEALSPVELEVEDVSHQHAGHAGAPRGSAETHFNVKVISEGFQGLSLVKRHRLVYGLLREELQNGLHALSLITKTPAEVSHKP